METNVYSLCTQCQKSFEALPGNCCPQCAEERFVEIPARNWVNPYQEALDVPMEVLINCIAAQHAEREVNPVYRDSAKRVRLDRLKSWLSQHDKLDGYIVESPSKFHILGARYGEALHEYIGFSPDPGELLELILTQAKKRHFVVP